MPEQPSTQPTDEKHPEGPPEAATKATAVIGKASLMIGVVAIVVTFVLAVILLT